MNVPTSVVIILNKTDRSIINLLIDQNKKLGLTRDNIAILLEIPRTTLYESLTKLEISGIVNKKNAPRRKGTTGRPQINWTLTGYFENEY